MSARRYAFKLLSMRNYHSAVLLRKLVAKGFSPEESEKVVEDCKRLGFIQDKEAILREWRRGYGPRYIECKLGLKRGEVRECLTRSMQKEKIGELMRKFESREKAYRTLIRRGFDSELIIEFFSEGAVK